MAITGVAARRAGKQVRLIGVEADAGHIAFAQRCMTESGFAEGDFRLHRGVAAAQGGVALFPRQTQAGTHWGLAPVFGASEAEQRAAERSADGRRPGAEALLDLPAEGHGVTAEICEAVVTACHPLAVAVAALVDTDRGEAALGELARRRPPGMAGLAAAMQQQR